MFNNHCAILALLALFYSYEECGKSNLTVCRFRFISTFGVKDFLPFPSRRWLFPRLIKK
jgi:hypothetical protein